MQEISKKKCRIYLTGWQRRMFSDFTSKEVLEIVRVKDPRWVEIAIGRIKCLASYKLPPEGIRLDDWVLYLNDTQITQVREELGVEANVTEINISRREIAEGNIAFM